MTKKPAIRVENGKRHDLAEMRRRRKLAKERAAPIEDTRVSAVWARADAKADSVDRDAAEARSIEAMEPRIALGTIKLENPNYMRAHDGEPWNLRHIQPAVNLRESGIVALRAKNALDEAQYAAAERYRRLFEAMGSKGASAIDYSREYVDGGRSPDAIGDRQIDAGRKLKAAYTFLVARRGSDGWKLVRDICGEGLSIHDLAVSRRARDTMTDNLRACLDALAEHWSLSTSKNVTVTQRPLQGLTSRA